MKNPNNEKPESENVDPSMRTAAWYRGVISLLLCVGAITAFVYGNVQISHGCMDRMLGDFMIAFVAVPVLLVGVMSGLIALGLFWNSNRGLWGALIFDLIVIIAASVGLVAWCVDSFLHGDSSFLSERLLAGSIIACVVLLFGAEMAWLMSKCRGRNTAWRDLRLLAAVLVVVVMPCPVVSHYSYARHVDVLRQYASTHWFTIPADASLRVFRSSGQAEGHWDSVSFRIGDACWSVAATHDSSKGWCFHGGEKEEITGSITPQKRPTLKISTEAEARSYLKTCGVPDGNIGPDWSLKTNSPTDLTYVFNSTMAGGAYQVTAFGNIKLCLPGPLLIPDSVSVYAKDQAKSAEKAAVGTNKIEYTLDVKGAKTKNPKEKDILEGIKALGESVDYSYIILGTSDMTYIQAGRDKAAACDLEYQEGDLTHHYVAIRKYAPGELKDIFLAYLKGGDEWKKLVEWKSLPVK